MKNIKKIYGIAISILVLLTFSSVNAEEQQSYINNRGVEMNETQIQNLRNLGYEEEEISNMTQDEFDENKDLGGEVVAQTTKYYRVETIIPNNQYSIMSNLDNPYPSFTYEITEEEYENSDNILLQSPLVSTNASDTVETTYKKMTTSIISYNNQYRYKNVVLWKKLPVWKVNDIIGIGFDEKVYGVSSSKRITSYYIYDTSCDVSITSNGTWSLSSTGYSVEFDYPHKSQSSANEKLYVEMYFDVAKNTTLNINVLNAYGNYRHLKGSSLYIAPSFGISAFGVISVGASYESHYDSMSTAQATLTGINW